MPPTHDFLLRLGVPVSGYSHRFESFEVRSQSQKQRQPRPSGALLARRSRGTASGRGGAAPPPGHPGPERAERGPLGRGSARSRSDRLSPSGAPVTSPITRPVLGSHDNRVNGLSLPFPCRVDGNLAHPVLNQDDFDVAGSRNRPRGECGLAGSAARLARAPRSRLARSGRCQEALGPRWGRGSLADGRQAARSGGRAGQGPPVAAAEPASLPAHVPPSGLADLCVPTARASVWDFLGGKQILPERPDSGWPHTPQGSRRVAVGQADNATAGTGTWIFIMRDCGVLSQREL